MAQLYQFLASGGEIQPLHLVRGVLDREGRMLKRYDKAPRPAQPGDSIAVRLITTALQRTVSNGTSHPLVRHGLCPLDSPRKTGASTDGRDRWFAGSTGAHLAVVWFGNDKTERPGLSATPRRKRGRQLGKHGLRATV